MVFFWITIKKIIINYTSEPIEVGTTNNDSVKI